MKVCLYSPYFPNVFGGGEKHLLDIATHLPKNWMITVAFPSLNSKKKSSTQIREEYESFYGKSLKNIRFLYAPLGSGSNFLEKLWWTKQFDYLFSVSDGSLFFSLAKNNLLHVQIPFQNPQSSFISRLKLKQWKINTNSEFTKNVIAKSWGVRNIKTLNPMVAVDDFSEKKKEKTILHVGRFFRQLHSKRQDVLVNIFSDFYNSDSGLIKDWKLILVGTVEDQEYFGQVKKMAKNLPVEFISGCSRSKLIDLYERASIYWHATGFGVDTETSPEKAEHFGITTVEAMAAGAVPIVYAAGGQPEVVGDSLSELLWKSSNECVKKTIELVADKEKRERLSDMVRERASVFGERQFVRKLNMLFGVTHE